MSRPAEIHSQRTPAEQFTADVIIAGGGPTGAMLAAATVMLLALGLWFFSHSSTRRAETMPAIPPEKRIAVLPFKPLLPENRDPVLELGMADTLIAKLSNSREIIVASLNSVRKFVGLEQDSLAGTGITGQFGPGRECPAGGRSNPGDRAPDQSWGRFVSLVRHL